MALAIPLAGPALHPSPGGPLADRVRQQTEGRKALQAALPQQQTGYSSTPVTSAETVLEVLAPGGPLRATSPPRGPTATAGGGSGQQMLVPSMGLMSEGGGQCYGQPWGSHGGWPPPHGAPAHFVPNSGGCFSAPALPSQGLGSSCSSTASLPYLTAPALVGFGMPTGNTMDNTSMSLSAASMTTPTPTPIGSGPLRLPQHPQPQQHPHQHPHPSAPPGPQLTPPPELGPQAPQLEMGTAGQTGGPPAYGWGWQGAWNVPPLGMPPPHHGGEPAPGSTGMVSAHGCSGPNSSSGGLTPPIGLVAPTLGAPSAGGLFPGPAATLGINGHPGPDSARSGSPPPPGWDSAPSAARGPSPSRPSQEEASSGSENGEGGSDLIAFARRVLGLSPASSKRPGAGSGLESDWIDVAACFPAAGSPSGSRPEAHNGPTPPNGRSGGDASGTNFWRGANCDSRAPSFSFQGNPSRDPSRAMADFGSGMGDVWGLQMDPSHNEARNPTRSSSPTQHEVGTIDVAQGIEALVLAEDWVATYDASILASSSILHYPNGAVVHLEELGALLRSGHLSAASSRTWPGQSSYASVALASQTAAAERYLAEQDHPRDLLSVYSLFDRERRGFLCWEEGQLVAFLEHLFRQRAMPAPSESQIYAAYTIFDPRRSMKLSARECLCLADALLRATVWQQHAAAALPAAGSKPAPPQHSRSSGEDIASFELSLSEEEVSGVGHARGAAGGASTAAAARSPAEALAQAKAETQRLRRELEYLKALEAEEAASEEINAATEEPPPARHSPHHRHESPAAHQEQQHQHLDHRHDHDHDKHQDHHNGHLDQQHQQPPFGDVPTTVTLGDQFDEGSQVGFSLRPQDAGHLHHHHQHKHSGLEQADTSALVEAARAHADNTRLERELQTLRAVASRQQSEARWLRQVRAQMTMAAREASEKKALEERSRELELKEQRLQELEKETERRQQRLQAMEEDMLRRGRATTQRSRSYEESRDRGQLGRQDARHAYDEEQRQDKQQDPAEEIEEEEEEGESAAVARGDRISGRLSSADERRPSRHSERDQGTMAKKAPGPLPDPAERAEDDMFQRRIQALEEREAEVERLQRAAEQQRAALELRERSLGRQDAREAEREEELRDELRDELREEQAPHHHRKSELQGRGRTWGHAQHEQLGSVPTPATAGLNSRSRRTFGGPWRGQFATETAQRGTLYEELDQPPKPLNGRRHLFSEDVGRGNQEEDFPGEDEAVAAARAELENRRLRRELEGLRSLAEWQQGEVAAYSSAAASMADGRGGSLFRRSPASPATSHLAALRLRDPIGWSGASLAPRTTSPVASAAEPGPPPSPPQLPRSPAAAAAAASAPSVAPHSNPYPCSYPYSQFQPPPSQQSNLTWSGGGGNPSSSAGRTSLGLGFEARQDVPAAVAPDPGAGEVGRGSRAFGLLPPPLRSQR